MRDFIKNPIGKPQNHEEGLAEMEREMLEKELGFSRNKEDISEIDRIRMDLWVRVAVAVAGIPQVSPEQIAIDWADNILAGFDKTFKVGE